MLKYGGTAFLTIFILLNAALGAWNLSGDPDGGKIVMGIFNLGAATFCAIVLARLIADWRSL